MRSRCGGVLWVSVIVTASWLPKTGVAQSIFAVPPEEVVSAHEQERLGAWIEYTSNRARDQRRLLGTSLTVLVGRWTSLGLALTGGVVLALTPVADFGGGFGATGYAIGGMALGVGLLGFTVSFGQSDEIENWIAYQQGRQPPVARTWRAAPMVGRGVVGAQLAGSF